MFLSWFRISDPKTGKTLATNVARTVQAGGKSYDESGRLVEEIPTDVQVISSEEIFIDPGFKEAWEKMLDEQNEQALKEECDGQMGNGVERQE